MGRKLPEFDPTQDGDYATSKRRIQVFKRVYQNFHKWKALRETGEVNDVLTIDGEEIYICDLMTGIDTLPTQQRKAFILICLLGYTESAATAILLPKSRWSTPVQQYSDDGLKKMIRAYDAKQAGTWNPVEACRKRRPISRKVESTVTTTEDSPEVLEESVEPKKRTRKRDFSKWSSDHVSLAQYVNEITGLGITAAQVKAVSSLRKEWYDHPDRVNERKQRQDDRAQRKIKQASESPEQRNARRIAALKLKAAEKAQARLHKFREEAREIRANAGLDPDTGESVA